MGRCDSSVNGSPAWSRPQRAFSEKWLKGMVMSNMLALVRLGVGLGRSGQLPPHGGQSLLDGALAARVRRLVVAPPAQRFGQVVLRDEVALEVVGVLVAGAKAQRATELRL